MMKKLEQIWEEFRAKIIKCRDKIEQQMRIAFDKVEMELSPDVLEDLYSNLDNHKACRYLNLIKNAENQKFRSA